jgi:hypothetical protein
LSTPGCAKHPRTYLPAIPYKRLLLLVQRRHHRRKVLPAAHRVGVLGAQALLADQKGTLVQGAGGVQLALVVQGGGEVVEAGGGGGVVGAQARLADGQGTLVQGPGAVEVALVVQGAGESASWQILAGWGDLSHPPLPRRAGWRTGPRARRGSPDKVGVRPLLL